MDTERYPILSGLNIPPKDTRKRVLPLPLKHLDDVEDNLNAVLVAMQENGYQIDGIQYASTTMVPAGLVALILYH